jgi:PD-(D/E)XK nuclease superfamily
MELEDLMNQSIEIMENDFYAKPFKFSYSSLNKLMWNPQAFYQMYVLGNREEKTESYLVNGKIIHCLLLEPEKFDQQFIVSPGKLPGDSVRVLVDRVYAHAKELQDNGDTRTEFTDFTNAVLDVLKDMNLHQSLVDDKKTGVTGDQKRIDKVYTPEAMNYWEFLKAKGTKILIDQENYDFCKTGVDLIKLNKEVCSLIGCDINEFSNKEVYNELPAEVDMTDKPFGLKGIIDNVVIDHDKQIIHINDIKTTSKELKDFPESIEFYNYWMQAAIYSTIIAIKFIHLIDRGYQFQFHFVVIDKNYQVYPFLVTENTLNQWFDRFNQTIEKAHWHYANKNYDLPYDFALHKITL